MIKKLVPALLALYLSGCVRLLPEQTGTPIERVDLMALPTPVSNNGQKRASIKVFTPTSSDILNSLRVTITRYKQDLKFMDYLADIEWKDNLLLLVQQRFMETLRAAHTFKSVSLDSEKFRSDYGVYSYIHKFEIEQRNDQIEAVISITLTLSEVYNNTIVEQKTFDIREKVATNTIVGYLVALNHAFINTQTQFIKWIEKNPVLYVNVKAEPSSNSVLSKNTSVTP